MMTIQSLHLYPIKGMRGIEVPSAKLAEAGFEYDRRWMLVNEHNTFISQRTHPILTKFIPSIHENRLTVNYAHETLEIPFSEYADLHPEVSVFEHQMRATELSTRVNEWFSQQLQEAVRLVHQTTVTSRTKNFEKYVAPGAPRTQTPVSFADGYPYLLLGTASMDLLNQKLDQALTIDRFRANIIVQTEQPHEEDHWQEIKIGTEKMLVIKPCARCQVTTIDQQTGERGKEPLRTLATYRKKGNKINFGANAISLSDGTLRVGDVLDVEALRC